MKYGRTMAGDKWHSLTADGIRLGHKIWESFAYPLAGFAVVGVFLLAFFPAIGLPWPWEMD